MINNWQVWNLSSRFSYYSWATSLN